MGYMQTNFQAGDIQRLIPVTKSRYEYLRAKIGIEPEIELVEGAGYSHIFSFRNLLDFAVSHHANRIGLTPGACKDVIHFLSSSPDLVDIGLYDQSRENDLFFHHIYDGKFSFYQLSGKDCTGQLSKSMFPREGFQNIAELLEKSRNREEGIKMPTQDIRDMMAFSGKEAADGFITLNLGKIKRSITR